MQLVVPPPLTGVVQLIEPVAPAAGVAVTVYWRIDEQALAAVLVPPLAPLHPHVYVFTPLVTAVPVPELHSAAPEGATIEAGGVAQTPSVTASYVAVTVQSAVIAPVV